MGWRSSKKGWFNGGNKDKKAWGQWKKKKWADKKSCKDDDDRKDSFDKKFVKCGVEFTNKDGWKSKDHDDFGGWKKKLKSKDWDIDLKIKKWAFDWGHKRDRDDDCDRGIIKFKNCKIDWKGCKVEKPCEPEIIETVCDYPEPPIEKTNTAPTITAPTNPEVRVDFFSQNQVVAKVVAEDLDNDVLFFTINDKSDADSPDADQFMIDSATGEVTMLGMPRSNGSADGDHIYQIEVDVTDGMASDSIILDVVYYSAA